MNLLHTIGLMRRAEHEAKVSLLNDTIDTIRTLSESRGEERNELLAKFKRAATDLAAEVRDRKKAQYDLAVARLEIAALNPAQATPSAVSGEPVQKLHELPEGHRWCGHCEQKDPHCSVCEGVGSLPETMPAGGWAGSPVDEL